MAAPVRKCELWLLTGYNNHDTSDAPEVVSLFLKGHYEAILDSDISRLILVGEDSVSPPHVLACFIKQKVEQLVQQHGDNEELRSLQVLTVAAACLQLFVQNNWLGPPTSRCPLEFCHKSFQDRFKDVENEALDDLATDGETVYSKCRHLIYLYIAKCLLLDCRSSFTPIQTWDWWLMRCLMTQQHLLSERSPTLKETVLQLIDDISNREPLMTDDTNRDPQILFHVEVGHALHTYFEYKKAAEHFDRARKISGIQVKLTGAMGKRTRFQESDTAQLVLQVLPGQPAEHREEMLASPQSLPKNLPLDDDTILNDVKFADNSVLIAPTLSAIEQVLIMGLMESYRRSRAQERLTDEEVLTYISFILTHVNNWSVSISALNLRSKLEKDSRRRVERSMMQLEELVKTAVTPDQSPDISCRISLFYACSVAPIWTVQRDLASLLMSLGCTGSALDLFEKLELWDDVIACYQKLGKREKAESVIRERLAVKETPSLLCYLGDVTRELEPYQRAWKLSGHRNARSMRCLGYIYFQEEKFEQAIECFATSLRINCLQIPVWFTYGCAAMACQKFDVGVKAFRQCVSIDYDNFEAWSNLATCYVKLHQKKKAYATLQDAIKCNFENWRLWENSLIIGTDCGEFEDVIRSYHRLIDLREKWIDTEVLGILTRAVVENIPDADGIPADRLAGKLMELFGRITSKVTSDGEIWAHYGKLSSCKIGDKEPDLDKTSQYLQKAYRCFTQKSDWEKDVQTCKKISEQAVNLVQVNIQCCQGKSQQDCLRLLSAAKLMVNGAIVKVKKQHTDAITGQLPPEVADICQTLEDSLSNVVTKMEALRHS
ncbi:hypothetical protein BsWGS_09858 [Bradybaena similaris]